MPSESQATETAPMCALPKTTIKGKLAMPAKFGSQIELEHNSSIQEYRYYT
jgi:hypothetical protein